MMFGEPTHYVYRISIFLGGIKIESGFGYFPRQNHFSLSDKTKKFKDVRDLAEDISKENYFVTAPYKEQTIHRLNDNGLYALLQHPTEEQYENFAMALSEKNNGR
jgi:hypothetical protein